MINHKEKINIYNKINISTLKLRLLFLLKLIDLSVIQCSLSLAKTKIAD